MRRLGTVLLSMMCVVGTSRDARAEVITVNSTADLPDADPGDGVCDADLGTAGLQCTLRAAVQHANVTPGADTIVVPAGSYRLRIRGADEDAAARGDLDLTEDVAIEGAGAAGTVIVCRGAGDRGFDVHPGVSAVISGLTVTGGIVGRADSGGAIRSGGALTMSDCILSRSRAGNDAGAFEMTGGVALLTRVWITRCSAGDDGGGIDVDAGSLTLDSCTISRCAAASEGGGIDNSGATVSMVNCTISGNKARSDGGGISLEDGGFLSIENCTVAFNRARIAGGITANDEELGTNTCTVRASIFASNAGGNSDRFLVSLGGNIDSGTTCGFDHRRTNPRLRRLAANGAATPTHAIDGSSPANGIASCVERIAVDQRGAPRGDPCDSGAFEFSPGT